MSCLNPILIKRYLDRDKSHFEYQQVRCRCCEDCKQAARSAAFVRCHYEYENCMKANGMAFFFTLTFADEYLPFKFHRMCFDKKLVQDWLQTFRQKLRRCYGFRLKYILVSELGHVGTHRPHHHGIFYLYPDTKYQLESWKEGGKNYSKLPLFPVTYALALKDLWRFGRCDVQPFDPDKGGEQYVSKYISKDVEEDNLFKDVITRIQIKRGKGDFDRQVSYYAKTYPSLHSFMTRYCPFTMISKDFGVTEHITDKNIEAQDSIFIDGFEYNIPRYYSDRYIRREIKEHTEYITRKLPYHVAPSVKWCCLEWDYKRERNVLKPFYLDSPYEVQPSSSVIAKYTVQEFIDLFNVERFYHGPMYTERYTYQGMKRLVKVLPKQSEVSCLSKIRQSLKFKNIFNIIEDKYYSLPSMLQVSCAYDIPLLLRESPRHFQVTDPLHEVVVVTDYAMNVLRHLEELTQVASEWRAKARITKREYDRRIKTEKNKRYARPPLTWSEYRDKSQYFNLNFSSYGRRKKNPRP